MNLTDNEVLKFQKGSPISLNGICNVYSVTLGEIVDEGYDNFQKYLSVLISEKPIIKDDQSELKNLLENLTNFQYLLMMASFDEEVNKTLKRAFYFFTHEEIDFSLEPAQIIIVRKEENYLLTEENFYTLQRILRRIYFIDQEGEEIVINDDDPIAVKRLKLKMRENREKLRKAKTKQAQKEGNDLKFSDLIGSVTINNCGLNMKNIWNITYYAFHDQLKRMGWRDQFNINNRAAMAGAKLKKSQLKHWMRSIADSEKT